MEHGGKKARMKSDLETRFEEHRAPLGVVNEVVSGLSGGDECVSNCHSISVLLHVMIYSLFRLIELCMFTLLCFCNKASCFGHTFMLLYPLEKARYIKLKSF